MVLSAIEAEEECKRAPNRLGGVDSLRPDISPPVLASRDAAWSSTLNSTAAWSSTLNSTAWSSTLNSTAEVLQSSHASRGCNPRRARSPERKTPDQHNELE